MANNSAKSTFECDLSLDLPRESLDDLQPLFIIQSSSLLLCAPITATLNALVLVAIYKTTSLHTPSNFLLFGLALTDLGAGAVAMPIFAVETISYAARLERLKCTMKMIGAIAITPFSGISIITITLVSIDRILALKLHMQYSAIVTTFRVISSLVCAWLGTLFVVLFQFWYYEVVVWCTVVLFVFCLTICSITNALILQILRRHRVDIDRQNAQLNMNQTPDINMASKRKTSSHMLWVYLLFLLCYGPFLVAVTVRGFLGKNTKSLYIAFEIPYTIMYLNSFLNPLLYCAKIRPLRKAMYRAIPQKVRCLGSQESNAVTSMRQTRNLSL